MCIEVDIGGVAVPPGPNGVPDPDRIPLAEGAPSGETFDEQSDAVSEAWEDSDQPRPDHILYQVECRDPNVPCETQEECVYEPNGEGRQWRTPGEPAAVTTEADLVADILVQLEDALPQPVIETNPPADRATIVHLPTFVTVTNWTGTYETGDVCAPENPDFCISAVAEPTMIYDPGEADAAPVTCDGPGQPYQPGSYADVDEQAGWDETCTYAYNLRSGVDDRPEQWPAQVTVTWTITWTPDTAEGTDAITLTTDIPREVNEVQSVVTG